MNFNRFYVKIQITSTKAGIHQSNTNSTSIQNYFLLKLFYAGLRIILDSLPFTFCVCTHRNRGFTINSF